MQVLVTIIEQFVVDIEAASKTEAEEKAIPIAENGNYRLQIDGNVYSKVVNDPKPTQFSRKSLKQIDGGNISVGSDPSGDSITAPKKEVGG